MAKSLQSILQDPEHREVQRASRARHMSIAEWVRQALACAWRSQSQGDAEKKLQIIRAAAKHEFPTGDIETMLAEVERGYVSIKTPFS